ncbi:hypothetical protein D9M68_101240 [compost metagenome]
MASPRYEPAPCYEQKIGRVKYLGRVSVDYDTCLSMLKEEVRERAFDATANASFSTKLSGYAETGMSLQWVHSKLLDPAADNTPFWEIGEAVAECYLAAEHQAYWPWNKARDKKEWSESLPGADLVGFVTDGDGYRLVLGEVKSSSDANAPPNVMYGRSGMNHQLLELVNDHEKMRALLFWLQHRVQGQATAEAAFESATRRYVRSCGGDMTVAGVLVRDQPPREEDLKARAAALAAAAKSAKDILLVALYLHVQSDDWAKHCKVS